MAHTASEIRTMFIWGAVGGALPTLGRIAGTFGADFNAPIPNLVGVIIALLLYSVIGSIVARAGNMPDLKQALFSGIAAPAIVVSVLAGASDSAGKKEVQKSVAELSFISAAYAQSTSEKIRNPRPITIETRVQGDDRVTADIGVYAVMTGSDKKDKLTFLTNIAVSGTPTDTSTLSIPNDAKGLKFTSATGSVSSTVSFDAFKAPDKVTVSITPRTSISRDFIWALGGKRNFAIGDLSAAAASE